MADDKSSSTYCCPYDGKFCEYKEVKFKTWAAAVEYNAANKINQVFFDSDESFDGCAFDMEKRQKCGRYRIWLAKKAKENYMICPHDRKECKNADSHHANELGLVMIDGEMTWAMGGMYTFCGLGHIAEQNCERYKNELAKLKKRQGLIRSRSK